MASPTTEFDDAVAELRESVPDIAEVLEYLQFKGHSLSTMDTDDALRAMYMIASYYKHRLDTLQSFAKKIND